MWNRRNMTIFVSLLTLYFFVIFFLITIDEEIHVLFIRIFCLRTLEVHTFEAVTRHNISQFLALMINEIKKVFLKLIKV